MRKMSEEIKQFIQANGLGDGKDEDRFHEAARLSQELDQSWREMFRRLISLENKGLIKIGE